MPNCCGEVIKNQAGGIEFFYCRGCKKEVDEKTVLLEPNEQLTREMLDELHSLFKSTTPPDML